MVFNYNPNTKKSHLVSLNLLESYKDLKITPEAHRKLRLYIAEKDIDTSGKIGELISSIEYNAKEYTIAC